MDNGSFNTLLQCSNLRLDTAVPKSILHTKPNENFCWNNKQKCVKKVFFDLHGKNSSFWIKLLRNTARRVLLGCSHVQGKRMHIQESYCKNWIFLSLNIIYRNYKKNSNEMIWQESIRHIEESTMGEKKALTNAGLSSNCKIGKEIWIFYEKSQVSDWRKCESTVST